MNGSAKVDSRRRPGSTMSREGGFSEPKISLGKLLITPGAKDALTESETTVALMRHQLGDWGNACAEDKATNDMAVNRGERVLSSYRAVNGVEFWIITEADRSATTVLLPDEY